MPCVSGNVSTRRTFGLVTSGRFAAVPIQRDGRSERGSWASATDGTASSSTPASRKRSKWFPLGREGRALPRRTGLRGLVPAAGIRQPTATAAADEVEDPDGADEGDE